MATETAINPEPVQSFFSKIEARRSLLSTITDIHKTLTLHFSSIDLSISQKSETLDARIASLRQDTENALSELRNREDGIPAREVSMAARVEELKAAAIADIENPRAVEKLKEMRGSDMLRYLCRRMDSRGLMEFLFKHRRDSSALRAEISDALQESVDPMRLVLDAAEDYVGMKEEGSVGMADRRRVCSMLIQSVVPLKEGCCVVSRTLKERAFSALEKWKGVLENADTTGGARPNEASMFLQIVVGFGLKQEFQEDFLRKLVEKFASRRDMPKLAMALGFGNIVPDIIDQLVNDGKEIEAAYFSSEAGLTEQYPPVPFIKASIKNCKKNARDASKKGNFSAAAVEKANNLELDATKAIIQCVEDLKLESEVPLEALKKRVEQLESAKSAKRNNSPSKLMKKRDRDRERGRARLRDRARDRDRNRGTTQSSSRPPKAARFSTSTASPYPPRSTPRTHLGQPLPLGRYPVAPYNYSPSPSVMYEGHPPPSYTPHYNEPRPRSPASYPKHYPYHTTAEVATLHGGGPTHYGAQGSYGESPVPVPQHYGYPPPPEVTTGSALRGGASTHYAGAQTPAAGGMYGGNPAPPHHLHYGYSTTGVQGTSYEAAGPHGAVPGGEYAAAAAAYDYGAEAVAAASMTAYTSSYQPQQF
ncbi:hypothetical protein DM860_007706 [Cuscuta australis]|uniref:FRIGIDA-like protein n=1 Tax=Cuscuta australis TaxID=267555 RepID=A0A328E8F0_9ASTE|nr:hypothetical protein DM860_007706 [Cuscuta australis]